MTASTPTDLPDFPHHVGGYELLVPIGIGGMGTVYLAEKEVVSGVTRRFAIKLLHPQLRAEQRIADDMLEEAKLAALITHPHVVRTVEAGSDAGHIYLIMEYVEGVTLADMVRASIKLEQPLPLPIIGRIFCDALDGLHAAHEATGEDGQPLGLVHRDFSPQNVLVSADGTSKLTDFGIAKAISRIGATATGVVKGKISYLSPEQAMGQPLDRRADIWSAGVCLWEALCARRLFSADNDAAVLLSIVSDGVIAAPSSKRHDVPPAIDEVVFAALDRDRGARIPTAEAFRQRLEGAWRRESTIAERSEVARFVSTIAMGRFAERRQKAAAAKVQRDSDANVSGVRRALPVSSAPPPAPASSRRWPLVAAAGAGVALAALAGVFVVGSDAPRTAPVASTTPVSALRVEANAPIAQVQMGDAPSFLVPAPEPRLELPLRAGLEPPFTLVAVSVDGRRTTLEVEAWPEGALEVQFDAPVAQVEPEPVEPKTPPEPTSDVAVEAPKPQPIAVRPPAASKPVVSEPATPEPVAPEPQPPPPAPAPVVRQPPPPSAPGLGAPPYKRKGQP